MKKSLSLFLLSVFIFTSCGGGSSSKKHKNSNKSNRSYGRALDDVIYDNLSHKKTSRVHYSKYLKQNKEFDIPYTHNQYVQKWINYFTGRGRKHFARHLARSGRFVPYIHQVLDQYGMPRDIAYLSMIESGFNTRAKSWASAVGPWQFIRSTGAMYGLNADYYVDERRDVEKATHAAARHLKDLYNEFGDWYLAFAAYNAGSGKVNGAIRRDGRNYWNMVRGRYLRQETKDYVPKILAAATIAKNPEKYGFYNINYQAPIPHEVAYMKGPTDLVVAAECAGVEPDLIRLLNPELLNDTTPPHLPNYALKIPRGTKSKFNRQYASLKPSQRTRSITYVAKGGDTVSRIASRYGVKASSLARANPGKVQVRKSSRIKKVKVAYKRRGRKRYRWKKKKVTIASYSVRPGAKLTIPKNRSLNGYSSIRDDQIAYKVGNRYGGNFASINDKSAKKAKHRIEKLTGKELKKQQKIALREAKKQRGKSDNTHLTSAKVGGIVSGRPSQLQPLDTKKYGSGSQLKEMALVAPNKQNLAYRTPTNLQAGPQNVSQIGNSIPQPSDAQLKAAVRNLKAQSPDLDVSSDPEFRNSNTTSAQIAKAKEKVQRQPDKFHLVKRGETLTSIAKKYRVSVNDIKAWNGKKVAPYPIAGAKIQVGGTKAPAQYAKRQGRSQTYTQHYKVRRGDNLAKIAQKYGVTTRQLKAWNGKKVSPVLRAGSKIVVKKSQVVKYKVKKGDSLAKIARAYRTTPGQLKRLNGLKSHVIQPGTTLVVK